MMGAIPILFDEQEIASSPRKRLTIKSVKREEKKVTQNPTENPYELAVMDSESKDTFERIVTPTKPTRIIGLPKREGYGVGSSLLTNAHYRKPGAEYRPKTAQNDYQERSNPKTGSRRRSILRAGSQAACPLGKDGVRSKRLG